MTFNLSDQVQETYDPYYGVYCNSWRTKVTLNTSSSYAGGSFYAKIKALVEEVIPPLALWASAVQARLPHTRQRFIMADSLPQVVIAWSLRGRIGPTTATVSHR